MKVIDAEYPDGRPIDGYGPGFFRVGGEVIEGPCLVLGDRLVAWTGLDDSAPLLADAASFDVLLIGTGAEIAHLPPATRAALDASAIAYEVMASAPAARTFNVLLSEGRRVAAALVPV